MALAFVNRKRFVTSNLIGATTLERLRTNLGSVAIQLPDDVIQAIERYISRSRIPALERAD